MNKIDVYIRAATRENTRRSYQSAVQHYETEWGGFLPATSDNVARYLADHADSLAINTLRQRLAALAQWHISQGFPDPTKAPIVRKVFRGIQALHPAQEKQARPLQIEQIDKINQWLDQMIFTAQKSGDKASLLRCTRDKALLLLGFWRGFRGDELTRLRIEHIQIEPGKGMTCFLARTKGDRNYAGTSFKAPFLVRLCPVKAYITWVKLAELTEGAVFRNIDRWGHVANEGLHINSLIPLLRAIVAGAGIEFASQYTGHSLRRGFAHWATLSGWDTKTLMEYVGWKNVQSALRYVEPRDPFAQRHIESTLPATLVTPDEQ